MYQSSLQGGEAPGFFETARPRGDDPGTEELQDDQDRVAGAQVLALGIYGFRFRCLK